jgi:hypothetical protein
MSYSIIGRKMLGWDKCQVGQTSVGQMSVGQTLVGQKLRHCYNNIKKKEIEVA